MNKMMRRLAIAALLPMAACADGPTGLLPAVPVSHVEVGPAGQVLTVGDSLVLTAIPRAANGSALDSLIVWRSLHPGIATVRGAGANRWVDAHAPGTARIEAESGGRTGYVLITVNAAPPVEPSPAEVASVTITPNTMVLVPGQQITIQAVARRADGSTVDGRTFAWSIHPGSGAVTMTPLAPNGQVMLHAHTVGTVGVSAAIDDVVGQASVTVQAAPPPQQQIYYLFLSPNRRGIWTGQELDYSQHLSALGPNGTVPNPTVTWLVEDSSIATIDQQGRVQGLRAGSTKIQVRNGDVYANAIVTVFSPPSSPAVYDLTYDWWDGQWRMSPEVGTAVWADSTGAVHDVKLYAISGSLTMTDAGTYERVLRLAGWAQVAGGTRQVIDRAIVDRGQVGIIVGGEGGYIMNSTTTPGYSYTVAGAYNAGHLTMRAVIEDAPMSDYMLRLRQ